MSDLPTDPSRRSSPADEAAPPAGATAPDLRLTRDGRVEPPAARTAPGEKDARGLRYPHPQPPARGERIAVAPGVFWLRMPLPFKLDHINVWALDDGEGWAIVDTGVRNDATMQAWREQFAAAPDGRPLTRVFVTHMHPDHVGLAGWLCHKANVRLWMSRLEYLSCRVLVSDTGREAPRDAIDFYRRAGWGEAALDTYRGRFGNFGMLVHRLPDSVRCLVDGETLRIGAHDWRVIMGTGHSPEHACLYCPALKLLIAGDQVLPRISSNVSVYPMEPDADPMSGWLVSLDRLQAQVPDEVLVLPAHNEPFHGLHARIEALRRSQHEAMDRLLALVAERGRLRAIDAFTALFGRPIGESDVNLLGMATGESLAVLRHLVGRGDLRCTCDEAGVAWYAPAGPG